MTKQPPKAPPLYPKSHLVAASGIAALLSLALLVFPSSDVEAKRTTMSLEMPAPAEQLKDAEQDTPVAPIAEQAAPAPFAQIETSDSTDTEQAAQPAAPATPEVAATKEATVAKDVAAVKKEPSHRQVVVAKGDTLSTLFEKVGLPASTAAQVVGSDKKAKQFTQLKRGQLLEFELSPEGDLLGLHSKVSELDTIRLTKAGNGFAFERETSKPVTREAYAHGVIKNSLSQSAARAGLSHSQTMDMAS
ncbi:MAG: peptidase M23, partial [Proteobacteria bacterium]